MQLLFCYQLTLFSMLAVLLLDADILEFGYFFLAKFIPTAVLYLTTMALLLRKQRTSFDKALGSIFACGLVLIGFLTWPDIKSYQRHSWSDYATLLFFCLPLLLVVARRTASRKTTRKKVLIGGVPYCRRFDYAAATASRLGI